MFVPLYHFVSCAACYHTPLNIEDLPFAVPSESWLIKLAGESMDVIQQTLAKYLKRREKTFILCMSPNTED